MIKVIKKIIKTSFFQYTLISALASVVNYISTILFGRIFSVDEYGVVTTLIAFTTNAGIFVIPVQIEICKRIASGNDVNTEQLINFSYILNIIELTILIVANKMLCSYLGLNSVWEYAIVVLTIIVTNFNFVINGVAQGQQKFNLLGISNVFIYVLKAVVGIGLGIIGGSPVVTLIGMTCAEIIAIIVIAKKCHFSFKRIRKFNIRETLPEYLWILILYMVVSVYMNNGDLLIGRIHNESRDLGLYSVAISLAKISIFMITTPIATVILPKVSARQGDARKQKELLWFAEGISVISTIGYGVILYLMRTYAVRILYGSQYEDAINYILPVIFYTIMLSGYYIFYQYVLEVENEKKFTMVSIIVCTIAISIILVLKVSMNMVAIILGGAMCITMALMLFMKE